MTQPYEGNYPTSRGFISFDPNMPRGLWDPVYGPTHRGIDYALPVGTRLVAAIKGQVTAAGFSPDGAGNLVVIKNGDAYIKYFHMDKIAVKTGQYVEEGDYLGTSGVSGNTQGAHLHFQYEKPFSKALDPAPLINKKGEEAVYPNENDVRMVLADRGIKPSDAEVKKWSNNPKFRWPEFWKDVKQAYPTPLATTQEFVRSMAAARGVDLHIDEVKKWTGIKAEDFMADLVKQYPIRTTPVDQRLEKARQLIKQAEEALK